KDDRQYRRGLYMHWQRTFLHPMLANFDAPAREECTANRSVANTPQQALTLLNDPTFVEAARVLAKSLIAESDNDDVRFQRLYERALCRAPKAEELEVLRLLLKSELERRDERTAWTEVCRAVLNL